MGSTTTFRARAAIQRSSSKRGFTLPEVLVAMGINAILITAVMTTFMLLIRNGLNLQGYADMESEVRRAFEQFGIDARMANGISLSGNSTVTLTVPNNYTNTSNQVTYGYNSTNQLFYLVPGDGTSTGQTFVAPGSGTAPTGQRILIGEMGGAKLVPKVTSLTVTMYTSAVPLASTTDATQAKHVQLSVTVQRSSASGDNATETVVSAAFTLRNKT